MSCVALFVTVHRGKEIAKVPLTSTTDGLHSYANHPLQRVSTSFSSSGLSPLKLMIEQNCAVENQLLVSKAFIPNG